MALSTTTFLRVGAKSHVGKVRTENQDRMSRFTSPLGEVFVVADGMGGHQGGLTAVVMTIDGFDSFLRNPPADILVPEALRTAAQKTNERVYRLASSNDPSTAKMGSTVVLILINGTQMWVGHAGDSRAYLYRNGQLSRLTKDHSMVQKMIDHDMLTEEQARNHPDASVITRAFGQQPELELEISGPLEMLPGDGVLLCTDGLSGYVRDDEIANLIQVNREAQEIATSLIDLALAAGGEDNVTVQYILFTSIDEQTGTVIENIRPQVSPLPSGGKAGEAKPGKYSLAISVMLLVGAVVLGVLLGWLVARANLGSWIFPQTENIPVPTISPSPSPERREETPAPTETPTSTETPTATPEAPKVQERPNEPKGSESGKPPQASPSPTIPNGTG